MAAKKKDAVAFTQKSVDVLKEVGNICAGNATVALSQILFKKIQLEIPKVEVLPLEKMISTIDKDKHPIIGIQMETLGAINGQILLIFTEKSAFNLMDLLVGNSGAVQKTKLITQIGISSLKEIGNIVISSYLSTLSSLSHLPVFPSCPQFTDGMPGTVLRSVFGLFRKKNAQLVLIETVFTEALSSVNGKFFIAFDTESMKLIIKACENIALKDKKKKR